MHFVPSLGSIRHTGTKLGLGVFASRAIDEGELVELCPLVVSIVEFEALPKPLRVRVFNWEALAGRPGAHALALGYGSMYNHANPANLRYVPTLDRKGLCFFAATAIAAGAQLTINYNGAMGGTDSDENNWFQTTRMKPVQVR